MLSFVYTLYEICNKAIVKDINTPQACEILISEKCTFGNCLAERWTC